MRGFTVVFFHAHPDDEALLTGGTMARLAAEGHRVVLVTATAGERGLAAAAVTTTTPLAQVRQTELRLAAAALGCSRTVELGYPDSGSDPEHPGHGFADLPVEEAADKLAAICREEAADVLVGYDRAGGYGHPDHRQVHLVAARAADLAGVPLLLEATVDRRALQRALRWLGWLLPRRAEFAASRFDGLYSAAESITHRVDVRAQLPAKRAALQAHRSQATADPGTDRMLAIVLRLPEPLFRLALGREWFVEVGRTPSRPPLDDVLTSIRDDGPGAQAKRQ